MATLAGALSDASAIQHRVAPRAISIPVITTLVMLIGSSVLLFARLGHYSVWTDEASTAITAAGVWRTGDTSAWLNDHNLLTYRDGLLLKHQKDRYTSPLQFYLAAPFIGLLGQTAFAARLPFALCGLGTVLLMLRWLWKIQPPDAVWVAATIILLTTASFFLFQRQCRYFALATFLSMCVAYLYCNWNGSIKRLWIIGIAMALLLSAQYLDYAAVVACLLIDYGIWGRRRRLIRGKQWIILILPQLLMAATVCPIWNPIERAAAVVSTHSISQSTVVVASAPSWISSYFKLFWWNIRDLVACDFLIFPLLLICPLLYLRTKKTALLRAPLAMLIFLGGIVFFTNHPLPETGNAEVRYLAPLLPLCVGIGIAAVWGLQLCDRWTRRIVLSLAAVSMLLPGLHSSALDYYQELLHPITEPYTPVSRWMDAHVPTRSTVYVSPDWCVSPLMWDSPQQTYVWQLSDPPKPDYTGLDQKYFKGRIPPDYFIAFGPYLSEISDWQNKLAVRGIRYERVATIPVYYKEMFRPELIWRSSIGIAPSSDEQVYIFKRKK